MCKTKSQFPAPARRVMSLQRPKQKMSKSDPDERSRILLTDDHGEMRKKIMSALTDSENRVSYDPVARPGVSNLVELWSHLDVENLSPEALAEEYKDWNLFQLKSRVADLVVNAVGDVRERYLDILNRGKFLDDVLEDGTRKAQESAEETMKLVREAVGLGF
jgi:tryptophanyl-tRNA synthetase